MACFFDDPDAVKTITKVSKQLRPGGTQCVMPKYVSAIENTVECCGTGSPLGICNRKGNDPEKSCRGLWRQLVTPEEQETHIHNLRLLTLADFEEYQSKFAEKIQLRIYELYQQSKHERTLQAEKEVSDLQQSISQLQLQRATELDEVTSKNCESMTRTPIDKTTRKPFASLSKDDLIHMVLEAQSTIEKLSMSEKVQAIQYTPSKYQRSKQIEICPDFIKGSCKKGDACDFSHEEDGSRDADEVGKLKKEINELRGCIEKMKGYILDDANINSIVHRDVTCDGCHVSSIRGARYKCTNRENYDLCGSCFLQLLNTCSELQFERFI